MAGNLVVGGITTETIVNAAGDTPFNVTLGTAVASTSGTSIDFTGIPTGTKRITVTVTSGSTWSIV